MLALMLASAAGSGPVAFDCDSAVVEGLRSGDCVAKFGRLIDVRAGPRIAGKPTIELRYEPAWGTNIYEAATALLQRDGAQYRLLWRHRLVDASYGFGAWRLPDNMTIYSWSYDRRRRRITVTASRTVSQKLNTVSADLKRWLAKPVGQTRRFARQYYCYSTQGRFEPCGGPSSLAAKPKRIAD